VEDVKIRKNSSDSVKGGRGKGQLKEGKKKKQRNKSREEENP